MRTSIKIAALAAATTFVSLSHAAVINNREDLNRIPSLTMVTFTELKLDTTKAMSDLGQPYKPLGLVLPDQMVDPDAAVPGAPGNAAAVSTHVDMTDNATVQTFVFVHPQKALGFNIRDKKATSITVTAYDKSGSAAETTTLKASGDAQYVGFLRKDQDIVRVVIRAPHATPDEAKNSPLEIADVTFATPYIRGETTMLTAPPRDRHDIDGYDGFGEDSGVSSLNANFSSAGNLLAYGGDASGGASSGGSSSGGSAGSTPNHPNSQRPAPSAAPVGDTPTDPVTTPDPSIDHPAPLVNDPTPTTEQPFAPPALNAVVHLPEPAVMSMILVPLVVLGLRQRRKKSQ